MDELLKLSQGPGGIGAALSAGIIFIAVYLPKMLNGRKADQVEGNVFDRLLAHEKRMNEMDALIHKQQVKVTRLVVLVTHMNGLLVANGVEIPPKIEAEIQELTEEL